jgi:hypothetical protein
MNTAEQTEAPPYIMGEPPPIEHRLKYGLRSRAEWFPVSIRGKVYEVPPVVGESRLQSMHGKLAELQGLECDWDGYGAVAPNSESVRLAHILAEEMDSAGSMPDQIEAEAEGGISFYFFSKPSGTGRARRPRIGIISIYNHGKATRMLSDRETEDVVAREIVPSDSEFRTALREITSYVSKS